MTCYLQLLNSSLVQTNTTLLFILMTTGISTVIICPLTQQQSEYQTLVSTYYARLTKTSLIETLSIQFVSYHLVSLSFCSSFYMHFLSSFPFVYCFLLHLCQTIPSMIRNKITHHFEY